MKIIYRVTSEVIFSSENAKTMKDCMLEAISAKVSLNSADLSYADLSYANLNSANLNSANLRSANLRSADLSYANLNSANLRSADLSYADLSYATGVYKRAVQPLMSLYDQPGKIRLYKMVTSDLKSPIQLNAPIAYEVGKRYHVYEANTDENFSCGAGLHVATAQWIVNNWQFGNKILICEFTANDIACIPLDLSGKLRLHRMKVVGELDPAELGLK